jgi:hypothetical protein
LGEWPESAHRSRRPWKSGIFLAAPTSGYPVIGNGS